MKRTMVYAGRLERLLAYFIDAILLLLPSLLLTKLFGEIGLVTLASFFFSLAYYTYFTASSWQATPGKRLMNIYVMRPDNRRLTPRDGLERFLAFLLPSLPFYTSIFPENVGPILVFWLTMFWFLPILYTVDRAGMHDRLCNTRVVEGRADA